MGHRFCKNWLQGTECTKKQQSSSKEGPKGVQNQKICYISAIMTLQGPKIGKCSDLIGIIALEKVVLATDFVKIDYWAPNAQKQQSSIKESPKGVQNQKIYYISAILTLQGQKIGKCSDLIDIIALEKVVLAIDFVIIGYWVPNAQKQQSSSKKGPKGVPNQKTCYISAIMTLPGSKIGKCSD